MLDEHTLNALPEAIYQRINKVNTDYLTRIGEKVREIGKLSGGDLHKLRQLQTYGADIEAEFERATRKNATEIYDIIDAVARDVYADAAPLYSAKGLQYIPYTENTELQRYVSSIAKQTVGEYVNLSQHTAFCIFGADGTTKSFFAENSRKIPTSLSETYTRVIDEAIAAAQMGVTDYNSAMRRTMKALADSGIRTVDYATGYSRRLDTAVRQNVLWGVKQCSLGTAEQVGEESGSDGWEVSYHSNPRPTHEDMGGRQYAAGSRGVTIGGVYYPPFSGGADSPEALLQDYGCLHYIFPIVLGVSEPAYNSAELGALKANDKRTFDYDGETYTGYEATQMQRKIETAIRHEKDRANIFAASGDEEGRRQAQEKINQLTRHYAKFSKAAGLPTQKERMSISGFHRVKTRSELKQNRLTLSGGSSTIQEKPITMITDQAIARVPKLVVPGFSDERNALLQDLHKDLLRTARDKNGSNETAFVLSSDLGKLSEHFGSDKIVEFSPGTLPTERTIILLHNHPRNGGFSLNDLAVFVNGDNIKGMSAIRNNGLSEMLLKTERYSAKDFVVIFNRVVRKYGQTDKSATKILEMITERGYVLWLK